MKWKQIPLFTSYEASDTGLIRNKSSKKIITSFCSFSNPKNYLAVRLKDDQNRNRIMYAHRLIGYAFHGYHDKNENGEKYVIDHKDGDKHNNNINNLEWVTHSENMVRAMKAGLRNDNIEVIVKDMLENKEQVFYSIIELCRTMKINRLRVYSFLYLYKDKKWYRDRYQFVYNKEKLFAVMRKSKPCFIYDLIKNEWAQYKSINHASLSTGINAGIIRWKIEKWNTDQYCGYIISNTKDTKIPKYGMEFLLEEREGLYYIGREYKPKYLIYNNELNTSRVVKTIREIYNIFNINTNFKSTEFEQVIRDVKKVNPSITITKIQEK